MVDCDPALVFSHPKSPRNGVEALPWACSDPVE